MENDINYFDVLKEFNKKEDLEEEIHSNEYCKNCKEECVKVIKGEYICSKCSISYGVVIDSTQEWRNFSEDSRSSDPNRCGMPSNPLFKNSAAGSFIAWKPNEPFYMKEIRRKNIWISSNYREKSLINVFENMASRAKSYGIPNCIIERAKYKYKEISELKISRGENRTGIIASCLFIACYENKSRRSEKEIANIFMIPPTSMTKGLKKYNEIMLNKKPETIKEHETNISDSKDFIKRFCSNLEMNSQNTDICYYVCEKIEKFHLVSENTPCSRSAGCIYLVSYLFDLKESKKRIAEVCNTSEVTITKCFSKLIKFYIYLIPEEMLKFLALDFIHKFSSILEKYYDKKVYSHFLNKSLLLFKKYYNMKIVDNARDVTILSAAVVYYLLKELNFTNLGIDEVCDNFYLKKSDIQKYYEKIKKN